MAFFIQQTLVFMIPLMIVALAGTFSERSGVINLALEGIMIFGAFIGVLFIKIISDAGLGQDHAQLLLIIGILASMIGGGIFSLLLAVSAINLKADQTIGGTALNLLAPALVMFLIIIITGSNTINTPASLDFMLYRGDFGIAEGKELNLFEQIFMNKVYLSNWYALGLYIILSVILYFTKFGLRLRSCGEHPQAADSVGINVNKMRYIGVTISGTLAGLGGFLFALTAAGGASTGDVAGMGFLALAVMIFGNWNPLTIAGAAFVFGACKCIASGYQYIDINGDGVYALANLGISKYVYMILPYAITLIILAFTSKNSHAPKAEGQPFDHGQR